MYTPEQIFAAAQTIRPQLPTLLDADNAAAIDRQLTPLLAAVPDAAIANQILALLATHDALRTEAFTLLKAQYLENPTKLFEPLPGASAPPEYPRFKCATCGHIWSQLDRHEPIPHCETDPTHGLLQPL